MNSFESNIDTDSDNNYFSCNDDMSINKNIKIDRNEYYKKYYEKNKNKRTKKFICDMCGGSYSLHNKATHEKTKKHMNGKIYQKINNLSLEKIEIIRKIILSN